MKSWQICLPKSSRTSPRSSRVSTSCVPTQLSQSCSDGSRRTPQVRLPAFPALSHYDSLIPVLTASQTSQNIQRPPQPGMDDRLRQLHRPTPHAPTRLDGRTSPRRTFIVYRFLQNEQRHVYTVRNDCRRCNEISGVSRGRAVQRRHARSRGEVEE